MSKWTLYPVADVTKVPEKSGTHRIYKKYFWILTENDEIILWGKISVQANPDERICKRVLKAMKGEKYPGVKYEFFETVFIPMK